MFINGLWFFRSTYGTNSKNFALGPDVLGLSAGSQLRAASNLEQSHRRMEAGCIRAVQVCRAVLLVGC